VTDDKRDVHYGSLKTLDAIGPMHGCRLARRIEQISDNELAMNQGTLYPALVRLQQAGWISSRWTQSDSGRRVKSYELTRNGRKRLRVEEEDWRRAAGIVARFLDIQEDHS
jgi:transcriptional regulator